MVKKSIEIHSENILPIIKQWLYTDRDIFVRELVSNACDAIHKVKVLRDQGDAKANDEEFRIEVKVDKEAKTLTFIDTGIGMDAEEVEKYIAQIAFSSAEEFVSKYQSKQEGDQIIGHFGLGFYSAYMVADKVEINTLSYKKGAQPVFWSCDGSSEYELKEGTHKTRGTEITLHINKDNEEYLEGLRINQILSHYCAFLPYPIYLGDKCINSHEPLWIKPPSQCTEKEYLEFYRYLYPMQEDPLFWLHLNVDYPFHLKGILYFPKLRRDIDINKNNIKLFCNRVFVSDNCKDLIPNYLMVLQGVIDSPDIPLNVSRSTLQMDRTVRQLASHISKKVSDSLATLYRNDKQRYIKCWEDVSTIVKLGVMEDEKFYDRVKNQLIWKVIDGDWTTVEDYMERNKEKTKDKILYATNEKQLSHFLEIYRERGIEVLLANQPRDSYVIQHLERKLTPVTFQRIDGGIDENILDKSREKTVLDQDGKTEAGKLADFVRGKLEGENIEVEAKSLASDSLPSFIVLDEQHRRMRDYMMSLNPKEGMAAMKNIEKRTFIINTNNPLITAIQKIETTHPDLAADLVKQTYDMALLSQREMDPETLNQFITRTNHVLEKLAEIASASSS